MIMGEFEYPWHLEFACLTFETSLAQKFQKKIWPVVGRRAHVLVVEKRVVRRTFQFQHLTIVANRNMKSIDQPITRHHMKGPFYNTWVELCASCFDLLQQILVAMELLVFRYRDQRWSQFPC